jgi:Fic family protein
MGKTPLISPEIVDQIKLTREYLVGHPYFSLTRAHAQRNEIERNANRHSVEMEIPFNKTHKHDRRLGIEDITKAQRYLTEDLESKKRLDEKMLRRAAARIHGYDGEMIYRDVSAHANMYNYQYPDPSEIPNMMYLFLEDNKALSTNLERSFHSHFNIATIHPFPDGNGRLARLAGNALLTLDKLPPVQIYQFERKKYCDLLNAAQREYRETKVTGESQRRFYDFLAMKVQDSLNRVGEAILK